MRFIRTVLTILFVLITFTNICYADNNRIELTQQEKDFIEQHPIIRLGVDPNFIPYEFFDIDGEYKGIASDYIRLISERTGLKMEAEKNLTWAEAYEKAVERKLDVLPCVAKTAERENYFYYSEPYYNFQRVIIVKDSNNSVAKIEDLFYKTVAVEKGSSHHSYLKGFEQIEFSLYPSAEAALEAITLGRENYYVGNLATSSYLIKNNGMTGLKYIKIDTGDKQYLYFAIRKDCPELVGIINKGLSSITAEEKIAINNKWIGVENKADYSYILKIIGIIGAIIIGIFLVSLYWIIKLRKEVRERIKAQEGLKIAKEEAEEANLIKSTFLARMSHEIRTPLNAITGMTYLMKKTNTTPTQGMYLDKINQAAKNMLSIINDILDFSKIEAGKIELERVSFSLDKILQQVTNIVSFKIDEQGIDFIINKDSDLPTNYFGDPTRLEQILLNVVNNAIKFTSSGVVSLDVRRAAQEKDLYYIEFSVVDTGIGMTGEQLNKLFTPFDQGDSSINRRYGGTGLGLSIVKSLVEMMGGEICVKSSPGEGTIFNIRLKFEVDLIQEDKDKQKSATVFFKNIRAIVLEKNATYINILKNYLESFGITAEFTVSEDRVIQSLRCDILNEDNKLCNVLIVDYDTPKELGINFINKIKTDPLIVKKPRFILMTPILRDDLLERIEGMDIELCISKPIIASVLYNGFIEIFKEKVLDRKDVPSDKGESPHITEYYPYRILIVEDNKTNQFIAKTILEQAGFKASIAENGKEAVDYYSEHPNEVDLILMDLHMPVMNGYEATRIIREMNTMIPIVAMTADAITGVEEQCKSIGIDYYISKPFEPENFIITINNALSEYRKESSKASKGKNNKNEDVGMKEEILAENEGIERLGNNQDVYYMVLKEYYLENQGVLAALKANVDEERYEDAVQVVHKIKSSSGNIGAKRLYGVASKLQKALEIKDKARIVILHEQFRDAVCELLDEISTKISKM